MQLLSVTERILIKGDNNRAQRHQPDSDINKQACHRAICPADIVKQSVIKHLNTILKRNREHSSLHHQLDRIDKHQHQNHQRQTQIHGDRILQSESAAPFCMCQPHRTDDQRAEDKRRNVSGELKQFWRAFRNFVYADHQHGESKRKGRVDEGFDAGHVVPANNPAFLAAAAVNKFSTKWLHDWPHPTPGYRI